MSGRPRPTGEPPAPQNVPPGQRDFTDLANRRRVHLFRVCRLITCDGKSAVEALAQALPRARGLLGGAAADRCDPETVLVTAAARAACEAASRVTCPDTVTGLDAAMVSLPPEGRTAVVLRDLAGLPYERIAEMFCATEETVRSWVYRARVVLVRAPVPPAGQSGSSSVSWEGP